MREYIKKLFVALKLCYDYLKSTSEDKESKIANNLYMYICQHCKNIYIYYIIIYTVYQYSYASMYILAVTKPIKFQIVFQQTLSFTPRTLGVHDMAPFSDTFASWCWSLFNGRAWAGHFSFFCDLKKKYDMALEQHKSK